MQTVMQFAGGLLCVLVIVQLFAYLWTFFKQIPQSRVQHALSQKLLGEQIAAANALRIQREQAQHSWNGIRKFEVQKKEYEADDQCSFYLVPHDGKPLPLFQPGQYLTFRLNVPDRDKPVIRCYSLSDSPSDKYYRVTIKRVPPPRDKDVPPGVGSNFFHDHINEGDIIDVQAPRGDFFIKPEERTPAVLIGGGIGVTPMMSMAARICEVNPSREVWLFYGLRSSADHAFKARFEELGEQNENLRLCICYSRPKDSDVEGKDYQYAERVTVDLFKKALPSNNYEFYICGPPPMMATLPQALEDWGVPSSRVFMEAFGPASAPKKKKPAPAADEAAKSGPAVKVKFSRADKEVDWSDNCDNLLELAEEQGVQIDSGCRAGNCGTCEVALVEGKVSCVQAGAEIADGSCLACISVPDGNVVLDA